MALYNKGASLMGTRSAFAKGASLVIRAMLQSPYFLFRTELGAKGAPLNGYEMAAKLSLLLRGTRPDDKTLDRGGRPGKLDTADGAATLATTMLGDAAAAGVMRQFHGEWLHFDDFTTSPRSNVPTYKESLNAEYLEASYRFFDKHLHAGAGAQGDAPVDQRLLRPGDGGALRRDGAGERQLRRRRIWARSASATSRSFPT